MIDNIINWMKLDDVCVEDVICCGVICCDFLKMMLVSGVVLFVGGVIFG